MRDIVDDPGNCGQVSVSRCRSLRVDAFTVGIAGQIQKARRTGLTFAPEAGTWRMRQVINKLIREEDLYGAVDSRLLAGLAAGEAVLPHRPADRDRRGHARHRRAGPQLRRDRPQHTKSASVTASVGGFVPKPFTPFQWFGQNTVDELRRKISLLRDEARASQGRAAQVARPRGHAGRGARSRGATAGSAPSSRRSGAGAARSRSGPSTSASTCGSRPWPTTASTSTGTSTATAPRTRSCPGTTSPPACTRTSCGRTGRTRWPRSACPTAGGRRATTAAPAPATASSTSWRRPPRRRAAARAPARISRPAACPAPCRSRCARPLAGART